MPYAVRHPRSGVEVAGSTRPPPRSVRPPSQPSQDDADAHFEQAQSLLDHGNYRDAVFEAQRAMKLARPRPEQRVLYAWLLYQRAGGGTDVHAHVWSHLAQALEEDAECTTAHYFTGALLARAGQIEEAIAHLERALQLDPGHTEAAAELQRCAQQRARVDSER